MRGECGKLLIALVEECLLAVCSELLLESAKLHDLSTSTMDMMTLRFLSCEDWPALRV